MVTEGRHLPGNTVSGDEQWDGIPACFVGTVRGTRSEPATSRPLRRENVVSPLLHERTPGLEQVPCAGTPCGCRYPARCANAASAASTETLESSATQSVNVLRKPCATTFRPSSSVNLSPRNTFEISPEFRARGGRRPLRKPKTRTPEGSNSRRIRQNLQGLLGQGNAVLLPLLHPAGRNGPKVLVEVELRPTPPR